MIRPHGSLKLLAVLLLAAVRAGAHDPGLSGAQLQVARAGITATLTLGRVDVESLGGLKHLGEVLPESFTLVVESNRIAPVVESVSFIENDAVCQLSFPAPSIRAFTVESGLPALLPRGHRQFVSVRDAAGRVLGEQVFDASRHTLAIDVGDRTELKNRLGRRLLAGLTSIAVAVVVWISVRRIRGTVNSTPRDQRR